MKTKILLILGVIASTSAFANIDVSAVYRQGIQGDKLQNQTAIAQLQQVYKQAQSPLTLALLGSLQSAKAQFIDSPWQKLQQAERGASTVAKALKQGQTLPQQAQKQIAIVAGCTFVRLPETLHRHQQGMFLLDQVIAAAPTERQAIRCAIAGAKRLQNKQKFQQYTALLDSELAGE